MLDELHLNETWLFFWDLLFTKQDKLRIQVLLGLDVFILRVACCVDNLKVFYKNLWAQGIFAHPNFCINLISCDFENP